MSKNYYRSGDWNIICDVCGVKTKASQTKERWDGFRVCHGCWEPRHSMDFIRARADKQNLPFSRPIQTDVFVSVPYDGSTITCTPSGSSGAADYATADCARADAGLMGIL